MHFSLALRSFEYPAEHLDMRLGAQCEFITDPKRLQSLYRGALVTVDSSGHMRRHPRRIPVLK